jgi:small conductance mechanosensitive channel
MNFSQIGEWLKSNGLNILLILIVVSITYPLLRYLIRKLSYKLQRIDGQEDSDADKRIATISKVLDTTILIVIVGTAILMIFSELDIPITPVLASVGFVGLAFGLGAQTLVKDMISGLFILIENQYTLGDTVIVNGVTGIVEDMTLRTTVVRDVWGSRHFVPNGEIRMVANKSRGWSRALVEVGITYDADVDRGLAALWAIGAGLMADEEIRPFLLEEPVITGIEGLDDWAVRLRIMVKTNPDNQFSVQRYIRRQIRIIFEQEEVEIAFPRQDIKLIK